MIRAYFQIRNDYISLQVVATLWDGWHKWEFEIAGLIPALPLSNSALALAAVPPPYENKNVGNTIWVPKSVSMC